MRRRPLPAAKRIIAGAIICAFSLASSPETKVLSPKLIGTWHGMACKGNDTWNAVLRFKEESGKLLYCLKIDNLAAEPVAPSDWKLCRDDAQLDDKPVIAIPPWGMMQLTFWSPTSFSGRSSAATFTEKDTVVCFRRIGDVDCMPDLRRQQSGIDRQLKVEDVTRADGDVPLTGKFYPAGPHPRALVVFVPGGPQSTRADPGPTKRRIWQVMTNELHARGISTFAFDDRGIGGSGGNKEELPIESSGKDVVDWVEFLRAREDVKDCPVVLVGVSEGAIIVALIGANLAGISGVASICGPSVSDAELYIGAIEAKLRSAFPREGSDSVHAWAEFVVQRAASDKETLAKEAARDALNPPPQASTSPFQLQTMLEDIYTALRGVRTRSRLRTDSLHLFQRTILRGIPLLAIVGTLDQNPLTAHPERFREMLSKSERSTYVELLINHDLMDAGPYESLEAPQAGQTISPKIVDVLADWIDRIVSRKDGHGNPSTARSGSEPH